MKFLSTEIIHYQNNDSFPEKLDDIIEKIYQEVDNNIYTSNKELIQKSSHVKELVTAIRNRFNINLQIDIDLLPISFAAIYLPYKEFNLDITTIDSFSVKNLFKFLLNMDDFNKLINRLQELHKEKKELFKKLHNKSGYINLKYAKVDGYFKNIPCYLILDFYTLKELGISKEETTSVILHEIGHMFSILENHYLLEKYNISLFNVIDEINNNNIEKAEYIFKSQIATEEEFSSYLKTSRKRTDLTNYIAISYLNKINSQILNDKYLETVSESQADEFVSRFNRGKELVSGLSKLDIRFATIYENNKFTYILVSFFQLLFSGLLLMPFGITGFIIGTLILFYCLFNSSLDKVDMTYDLPLDRYNRIKNSIINNLKNTNLPKEFTKELLEQFQFIEEIVNTYVNNRYILTSLTSYILPTAREVKYYIDIQQKIEKNLNNTLFVSAAKLRTFETS